MTQEQKTNADINPLNQSASTLSGISWRTPPHSFKKKGADWYIAILLIGFSGTVSAFIYGNFLFAIFIIVAIFTLLLFDIKKPKTTAFALSDEGIEIDNEAHPYSSFESFWIIENKEATKLIFQSKKILLHHLTLPINEKDDEKIRSFLLHHLPEEETDEPFSAKIMEYLGF